MSSLFKSDRPFKSYGQKRFRERQVLKLHHGELHHQQGQQRGLGPGGNQIRGEGSLGREKLAGHFGKVGRWP